ncbi:BRCA1 protein, partial [Necator americanus]
MTTAYNFPDLNISPISIVDEEDIAGIRDRRVEDFQHTLPVHVPLEQSLKGLSISDSTPSGNPSVVPDSDPIRLEAASEDEYHGSLVTARTSSGDRRTGHSHVSLRLGDSFDESSEEAFIALENRMKHSLLSVAESCDIASASQDSFCYILSGCCVCVEMGCCKESSSDVRSCLRRMGAVVSRRFTETTTHVVFSYGGSTEILQSVFASSTRPFLVDPHWVHECFKSQTRVPEENFSLYECRYLVDALRRSLDQQNISGCRSIVLQNITNENGHVTHGNISEGVATVKITRRRTHGAFPLEYREPSSIAVKLVQESREEQYAICGRPSKSRVDNSDLLKENEEPRSTQACDLPLTSKRDAVSKTKKIVSEQRGTQLLRSPRKCLAAVENSSELGGLLGLKTPSQRGVYGPLVETASSLINELQSASSSA